MAFLSKLKLFFRVGLISLLVLFSLIFFKTSIFAQAPPRCSLQKEITGTGGNKIQIKNIGAGDFDPLKMKVWHYDVSNPQLVAKPGGTPNIYAMDVFRNGGAWNIYYGGWDGTTDQYDRISLGVSYHGLAKVMADQWEGRFVVVDHGNFLHINDPSIVKISANQWYMVYSTAWETGSGDNYCYWGGLGLATSGEGVNWIPFQPTHSYDIIINGLPADAGDISRPTLLKDGSEWKLYFDRGGPPDGKDCSHRLYGSTYLATSTDLSSRTFDYQGKVNLAPDPARFAIEPEVEKFNNTYLLVTGWFNNGIYWATGSDGLNFNDKGKLFAPSGKSFDKAATNPSIIRDGNRLLGVWYGSLRSDLFTSGSISAAYLQKKVTFQNATNLFQYQEAIGPENLYLYLPTSDSTTYTGTIKIYDSDGASLLCESAALTIKGGDRYQYNGVILPSPTPTPTPTPRPTATPTPRPTATPTPTPIPGDFNQDGRVNILDFRYVLSNFTDVFDYNLVVKNFGQSQ